MKKGFTLIELMFVIVLLGVATASSIIVFDNIDKDTEAQDKANAYKQAQRAAYIYLELDDTAFSSFSTSSKNEIFISYDLIKNSNYVTADLYDYNGGELAGNYVVKIYIAKDKNGKDYLNSCLYSVKSDNSLGCVADNEGNYGSGVVCCP